MTTTELTGAEDVAWDLSDLYESGDDPRIDQDVAEADAAAAAFRERYYGRVAELSPVELAQAIDERERIESIFTRAIYYAHLWFSTDMADSPRGALLARLTEKGAATLDTQLLFFGLELAALDDSAAAALLADSALERWSHWLRSVRKFRPYLLSEPEEKIFTEKSVSGVRRLGPALRRAPRRAPRRSRRNAGQLRGGDVEAPLMVKDHRTNFEVGNTQSVLNGGIEGFIEAYLRSNMGNGK